MQKKASYFVLIINVIILVVLICTVECYHYNHLTVSTTLTTIYIAVSMVINILIAIPLGPSSFTVAVFSSVEQK